jgi:hypothetical protein
MNLGLAWSPRGCGKLAKTVSGKAKHIGALGLMTAEYFAKTPKNLAKMAMTLFHHFPAQIPAPNH